MVMPVALRTSLYIVIRELAHLKEMNHSKKFWQVVAGCCPRWREMRKLLKKHDVYLRGRLLDNLSAHSK